MNEILRSRGGPIDIAIGFNIRRYRTARDMSQSKLGSKIGVTFQQIQKYEKGKNAIPSTRLAALAVALNISLETLLDVKGVNGTVLPPLDLSMQSMKMLHKLERLTPASRYSIYKLVDTLLAAEGKETQEE